jgi:hypothetical protein
MDTTEVGAAVPGGSATNLKTKSIQHSLSLLTSPPPLPLVVHDRLLWSLTHSLASMTQEQTGYQPMINVLYSKSYVVNQHRVPIFFPQFDRQRAHSTTGVTVSTVSRVRCRSLSL